MKCCFCIFPLRTKKCFYPSDVLFVICLSNPSLNDIIWLKYVTSSAWFTSFPFMVLRKSCHFFLSIRCWLQMCVSVQILFCGRVRWAKMNKLKIHIFAPTKKEGKRRERIKIFYIRGGVLFGLIVKPRLSYFFPEIRSLIFFCSSFILDILLFTLYFSFCSNATVF